MLVCFWDAKGSWDSGIASLYPVTRSASIHQGLAVCQTQVRAAPALQRLMVGEQEADREDKPCGSAPSIKYILE